ncbi:hypothetical protein J4E91_001420 [Alternaria rosae]|nr:hypothetical protein J4E91_001420 [Alternaria rosae]
MVQSENLLRDSYSRSTKTTFRQDPISYDAQREHSPADVYGAPQIQDLLIRAGNEFPNLLSRAEEPVEEWVTRILHEYRELTHSLAAAHRLLDQYRTDAGLIEGLKTEVHKLRNELRASNTAAEKMRNEARNSHQQMLKAQGMLGERNVKFEQERGDWEREREKLNYQHDSQMRNETQRMNSEMKRNKTWYEEQLLTIRHEEEKRHEQDISSLKQQLTEEHWKWDAYLREVKDTHETCIKKLEASFKEEMENKSQRHHEQMRQEMERHEETVNEYRLNIAQFKLDTEHEKQQLREQLQTEQERLQEEQKRREKDLKRQEAQLTHKHTHETLQLRTVNEELKQGLFQRQHFRGLKDRDLANSFRSIAGQVQDFANIEWDGWRTSDWPFSEHQLLDIHRENTRKLKKQIVQNSLWFLLHDWIFASPFKILGSEGEILDREWIAIHTPSKSWIVAILRF